MSTDKLQKHEIVNSKERVAFLKLTKKTFSDLSGESISDDDVDSIVNRFQALLHLLDSWNNENELILDKPSSSKDSESLLL